MKNGHKIVIVDLRTGKATGVKVGKCKIYCIELNGVKTTVSVTVK